MELNGAYVYASPTDLTETGRKALAGRPRHPRQPGPGHLRGGRGRRRSPRLQVRAGQRAQPRAAAPDRDRRRGARAGRRGRRLSRRGDRLRRRRLQLRRHRLPLHARDAGRQGQDALRRGRADRLPVADQRASSPTTSATSPRRTPLLKMYTLGHDFMPAGIHAGGLRYHAMAPLISHAYHLGMMEAVARAADQGLRRGPAVHADRGHPAGARVGARDPRGHRRGACRQGRGQAEDHPLQPHRSRLPRPRRLRAATSPASSRTTTTPRRPSRSPWSTCRRPDECVGRAQRAGRGARKRPPPASGTIRKDRMRAACASTARAADRADSKTGEAMPDLRLYRVALIVAVILAAGLAAGAETAPADRRFRRSPRLSTRRRPSATSGPWRTTSPGASPAPSADRRAGRLGRRSAGRATASRRTSTRSPSTSPAAASSLNERLGGLQRHAQGAIVVLAPRDSPPLSTQGANDDASGTAALLELASVFAGAAHLHPHRLRLERRRHRRRPGRARVPRPPSRPADRRRRGTAPGSRAATSTALTLNGWSARPLLAPPWLWSLARAAGRARRRVWHVLCRR